MNGVGSRRAFGIEPEGGSPFQDVLPTGRAMAKGYRQDSFSGFGAERPRYNPLNVDHPQSSPHVDLKDPIQVHLLTETALSDSQEWVILSPEEVDDLKKQCQSIVLRIEQTRANLAIQSKYRDAAISMTKLYSPGKRRSILNDHGSTDAEREADAEKAACEQKCEELASELFSLEKRLMEPQRRLFQHTAGILQLTHRGSKKNKQDALRTSGLPADGVPGSPESMYTYDRESMEIVSGGSMFDDRSLYLPIDQPFDSRTPPLKIPQKSPIRTKTLELHEEESDSLRDTNMRLQQEVDQLRAASDSLHEELAALQRESSERLQMTAEAERQMEDLNGRLREIIVRFNPNKNGGYGGPPPSTGGQSVNGLTAQIEYLGEGLSTAQQEQEISASERARQSDLGGALAQFEDRMVAVNNDIQRLVSSSGASVPPIPPLSGDRSSASLDAQLSWLEDAVPGLESGVGRAVDAATGQQTAEQMDAVLVGLWDIIQTGFAAQQRQREEYKAARAQKGLAVDEDDMSGDESPFGANEQYSLQALSSKVQWLYAQTTKLREHKSVLKRQIKQQRELNNKSDAEKDLEIQNKAAELEAAQDQLAKALLDLKEAQSSLAQKDSQLAMATRSVEQQLSERSARLAALETEGVQLQGALATAEASVSSLTAQLKEVSDARDAAAAHADKVAGDLKTRDQELEDLNMMLIELKTEATIAKAELDGAYGTRSQRAKDVAAYAKSAENEVLQTQLEVMQSQLDNMKKELSGTLKEYEVLTKDAIAAEREKLELEAQLDDALAAKASLESEVQTTREKLEAAVASLQDELDAEKLKVPPGGATSRTGATLLSEQFRATMKGERKKYQEELRGEQAQRRKLEEELRTLKRAAGHGKSPLSPRSDPSSSK